MCNRPDEEFWKSSLTKVLYVINKRVDKEIEDKNFYIGLFKSIGSKMQFIKVSNEPVEKDIYVDSFNEML